MDNEWKTKDCSMCNYCICDQCHRNPPRELRGVNWVRISYPRVISGYEPTTYMIACSLFEAKTKDQKPGDAL